MFPTQWSLGIVNPIYKQKDKTIPENYRKVTLLTSIGKCFEGILHNRLNYCKTTLNTNDPLQNGFKADARAIDNTFILNGIIEKYSSQKRPLYVAFVDFKSAFDNVNRNALLFKMARQHIHGKFLKIVKDMLWNAKSQVKWNHNLGEIFKNLDGVLQGGVISPTLFNLFMEDLPNYLGKDIGVKIGTAVVNYLLHADDLVLMAETRAGLQALLDRLSKFCKRWDITINVTKTNIMLFNVKYQIHTGTVPEPFTIDGELVQETDKYKYLGSIISNTSTNVLKNNYSFLRGKALRAIYALRQDIRKSINIVLPIELMFKSFDVQIRPILDYGAELWCQIQPIPDIEYVQNFFLKTYLKVREQTPTQAVLGETGRLPLFIKQHDLLLKYLKRFETMDKSRTLYKIYEDLVALDSQGHRNWVTKAKAIKALKDAPPTTTSTTMLSGTNQDYAKKWLEDINNASLNPKLRTYKLFKNELCLEPYITSVKNVNHRIAIARFRTSSHNLHIEKGRHCNPPTPIEKRICHFCPANKIDDEHHMLMECSFHNQERNELFNTISSCISFEDCSTSLDKFVKIMSGTSIKLLDSLGRYLYLGIRKRENVISVNA